MRPSHLLLTVNENLRTLHFSDVASGYPSIVKFISRIFSYSFHLSNNNSLDSSLISSSLGWWIVSPKMSVQRSACVQCCRSAHCHHGSLGSVCIRYSVFVWYSQELRYDAGSCFSYRPSNGQTETDKPLFLQRQNSEKTYG